MRFSSLPGDRESRLCLAGLPSSSLGGNSLLESEGLCDVGKLSLAARGEEEEEEERGRLSSREEEDEEKHWNGEGVLTEEKPKRVDDKACPPTPRFL